MTVPVEFGELTGLSRQERLDHLRRRMAAVPARGEAANTYLRKEVLPVPEALAAILPNGGLAKGSVVSFSGATSLLLGLLATVTGNGGNAGVIGRPGLSLLAATEMGAQLRRIALIPEPGPDPVEVAAVLLDGLDLVVLDLGGGQVAPSRSRAVVARARSRGSTLLVSHGQFSGVELRLDARVVGYRGLGRGTGRLRSMQVAVRAQGRACGLRTTRLDLQPGAGAMEWVPAAEQSDVEFPQAVSW
nr:hypothetical protein [Skermania sp. ID1734]